MNSISIIIFKSLFLAAAPFTMTSAFNSPAEGGAEAASYIFTDARTLPEMAVLSPRVAEILSRMVEVPSETPPLTAGTSADTPQEGIYDVMLDSVCGPLTYYNQSDARWGNYLYGGKDPLSTYGCGPTAMAMLITSFTGNQVLPTEAADWAASNRSWCPGEGSYHRIVMDSSAAYGLKSAPLKDYTLQGIQNALNSGYLVVALMNKGHFTQQGHFIIITRVTEDGKIRLADPNNYDNTKYDWDPSIIFQELNYRASNGGPLWMVGPPDSHQ